ncbi:hypothetical protein, partial [uncultured Flavonifractor sp.]|uniref:hypothetical protein n=1 Tax=uncultured Flavonifractor sp. TaxID=1193534 RepID=UPI0026707124
AHRHGQELLDDQGNDEFFQGLLVKHGGSLSLVGLHTKKVYYRRQQGRNGQNPQDCGGCAACLFAGLEV